jgi:hypothetical protein
MQKRITETDDRRSAIKNRDGEFVQEFVGSGWETVKRDIVWIKNKNEARAIRKCRRFSLFQPVLPT